MKIKWAALIVGCIILNVVAVPIALRFDLSKGKAYTLSNSTKAILRKLDKPVTFTFYTSSSLPTRLLPVQRDVKDLLNEYRRYGGSKFKLDIKDPRSSEKTLQEVRQLGLPEIQFSQFEKDKYAVSSAFFGASIAYRDKKEIIPQVAGVDDLEYNLTSLIYKLSKKSAEKIGILGGAEREGQIATFKEIASAQFDIGNIASPEAGFSTAVLLDTNSKEYKNDEIKQLEEFIKKGGKLIAFVDGVWVKDDMTVQEAKHNLFDLFRRFGIDIQKDLVLSESAELVNFGGGDGQFQIVTPYPLWIKTNQFNKQSSLFSNISQVTFPWVSSIAVKESETAEVKAIIKTRARSWNQKTNFTINPQSIPQPAVKDLKSYTVAAYSKLINGGELVVIPSSRFILDQYLGRTSNNLELAINILNDFASKGALSGIRQRSVNFYIIPDLPQAQKDIFKYLNILLLPAIFVVYGALRLYKRR